MGFIFNYPSSNYIISSAEIALGSPDSVFECKFPLDISIALVLPFPSFADTGLETPRSETVVRRSLKIGYSATLEF
jgi:hypothetical protein